MWAASRRFSPIVPFHRLALLTVSGIQLGDTVHTLSAVVQNVSVLMLSYHTQNLSLGKKANVYL